MRKDVKLGFSVGAVLVAVIVVYMIVASHKNKDGGADLAETGTNASSVDHTPEVTPTPPGPAVTTTPPISVTTPPVSREPAGPVAVAAPPLPTVPPRGSDASTPSGAPSAPPVQAEAGNPNWNWGAALRHGHPVPYKLSASGDPTDSASTPAGSPTATGLGNPASGSAPAAQSNLLPVPSDPYAPTTPAGLPVGNPATPTAPVAPSAPSAPSTPVDAKTGARNHVVAPGETFSSIARVAYGKASYYTLIQKANPNVDSTRLRPGMTLVLPEAPTAQATVASGLGTQTHEAFIANTAKPVNPTEQYTVQSGDSLYAISTRLYGRGDRVEKIYQLNKELIGSNPARLKVNMVLRLPEPPLAPTAQR